VCLYCLQLRLPGEEVKATEAHYKICKHEIPARVEVWPLSLLPQTFSSIVSIGDDTGTPMKDWWTCQGLVLCFPLSTPCEGYRKSHTHSLPNLGPEKEKISVV